jgi:hypothetical protein
VCSVVEESLSQGREGLWGTAESCRTSAALHVVGFLLGRIIQEDSKQLLKLPFNERHIVTYIKIYSKEKEDDTAGPFAFDLLVA